MQRSMLWNIGKAAVLVTALGMATALVALGGIGFVGIVGALSTLIAGVFAEREIDKRRKKALEEEYAAEQKVALDAFRSLGNSPEAEAKRSITRQEAAALLDTEKQEKKDSRRAFIGSIVSGIIGIILLIAAAATGHIAIAAVAAVAIYGAVFTHISSGMLEHKATVHNAKAHAKAVEADGTVDLLLAAQALEQNKGAGEKDVEQDLGEEGVPALPAKAMPVSQKNGDTARPSAPPLEPGSMSFEEAYLHGKQAAAQRNGAGMGI